MFCVFFIASLVELSFGLFCFVFLKTGSQMGRTKNLLHIDPPAKAGCSWSMYHIGKEKWPSPGEVLT